MNVRKTALIAAGAMALVFGIALFSFVRSFQHANAPELARVRVLVANAAIDKGVTVTGAMFSPVLRDRTTIDSDSISDPRMLHGQFALIALPAGSVLTQAKIGTPRDIGLSMRLKPGERAVSISVDQVKDVSGLLLPGDRVDVLVQGPRIDNKIIPAVILLRGVLVLAVGQGLETTAVAPGTTQANASTVTLALTPHQSTALLTADQNATIRLALRSPKESLNSERMQEIIYNGRKGGSGIEPDTAAQPRPAAPVAVPAPVAAAVAVPAAAPVAPRFAAAQPRVPGTVNGVQMIEGATLLGPG